MGDRALVIFTDKKEVSPAVYLHWSGNRVPEFLEEHRELMKDRRGDVSYAAARFTGLCHTKIPGNLSLGLFDVPKTVQTAIKSDVPTLKALQGFSHGDAGVVIVDVNTGDWKAYAGYLAD